MTNSASSSRSRSSRAFCCARASLPSGLACLARAACLSWRLCSCCCASTSSETSSARTSSSNEGVARRLKGFRDKEGAKRVVCCWREREEAVLALERRAWCEGGGAAAAARRFGGAMVGCRKGASENGSLEVWVWRVGGMVEVVWMEDNCVEGADRRVCLLLAVLPHVRAFSTCRKVHACRQYQGILKPYWSSAHWCKHTQLSHVCCIAHGEEHSHGKTSIGITDKSIFSNIFDKRR
jgi:hypothetical protein